uniref:Fn14 n=1 Tax=Xenopus laevis TaxID=8355 RepID=UPI00021472C6|nr:Chain A, Fn14 [Xenopus laevis]
SQGECPEGRAYSQDLGKCMECSVCKNSEKSDFCQNCPSKTEQPDFPWIWVEQKLISEEDLHHHHHH